MKRKQVLELEQKPVGELLIKYATPAIIAQVATSLYNMVDSIFIGQGCGAMALSGLSITFPLMNLSAAFGAMIGVGGATVMGVKLGQHDYEGARRVLGSVTVMNVIIGFIFGVVTLACLDSILRFFGASPVTLPYAHEYMVWILCGNMFTHMYFGQNNLLRTAGHPRLSMYCTIVTVLLNAILDPIFIYTFGWGMSGAAFATVLCQFLSMCAQMYLFCDKREVVHFTRSTFALDFRLWKDIIKIGVSPFALNSCACLVIIVINRSLYEYGGDIAVGAYGINNRIMFMFVMIVFGINQGMQPISSYNYGAGLMDRVVRVFSLSCVGATVITTMLMICGEFIPEVMMRMFTSDAELIEQAVHGMRINVSVFCFVGFQMVTTAFFVSIGRAGVSVFLSLTRQMLYMLPLLVILPEYFGLDGVWYALPISDFMACVTALLFLRYEFSRGQIRRLRAGQCTNLSVSSRMFPEND